MSDLTLYLKSTTDFFKPPMMPLERFILEHGTDYPGAKRPKGVRKMRDKECFANATKLHWERGWRYVEGFADAGILPTLHAWNLDDDGNVVDATWRHPEKASYRGVIIPRELLNRTLLKRKYYGALAGGLIHLDVIEELKTLLVTS